MDRIKEVDAFWSNWVMEVPYAIDGGTVIVTLGVVENDLDHTLDSWAVTALAVDSSTSDPGFQLTATLLRRIPVARIVEKAMRERPPYTEGTIRTELTIPTTSQEKVEAAANAWHYAKSTHSDVVKNVRSALGGISHSRATHYISQARSQGLIPEEGRRGPKPKGKH